MSRYKNMTDDFYYCINNGFDSSLNLVCDECYHLTFLINDFINIRYKDKYFRTWIVSSYQNFEDYFISRAEWREQQMKAIIDD